MSSYSSTVEMPDRQGSRGFTLIELLIALTLVGLIAVLLHNGLRFGTRAWEAGSDQAAATSEVEVAQRLLRQQLEQAHVEQRSGEEGRETIAFAGTSEALAFVGPLPAHRALSGLYLQQLFLERQDDETNLMIAWRLFDPEVTDLGPVDDNAQTILVEAIEDIEFSYLTRERENGTAEWHDSWQDEDGFPTMVRVRIQFPEDDRRYWPELLIPLRLSPG